jgi:hypothetical protein
VRNRLRDDTGRIRFHEVVDGEIVIADAAVVLEMLLDDSVAMVIYDRARRLAAASKLCLGSEGVPDAAIHERVRSASLALLTRLAALGSDPGSLEIYALGAAWPGPLCTGPDGLRLERVAMAAGLPAPGESRRVEFDVGLGRIVVEPHCGVRRARRAP